MAMLCVAAVVQGWTQTVSAYIGRFPQDIWPLGRDSYNPVKLPEGHVLMTFKISNGANLNWPYDLGLKSFQYGATPTAHDVWAFAAVNAAPYLAASV